MKTLLTIVGIFATSSAMACPNLAGDFQFGAVIETISQDLCNSVTFTVEGNSMKAMIDGSIQATGDGEFDIYSWTADSLVQTVVTEEGQAIGLVNIFKMNATNDLEMTLVLQGKAGKTNVAPRVNP